jgi:hypothetical protein
MEKILNVKSRMDFIILQGIKPGSVLFEREHPYQMRGSDFFVVALFNFGEGENL